MLVVDRVTKTFIENNHAKRLFSDLSFQLGRHDRLAILGRNGQGKSTLIKILGGVLAPTSGTVRWTMSASWPLGFGGAFHGNLTGYDNVRFLSRIYDQPFAKMLRSVEEFAELGDSLTMMVKHYSSGMRARLAFGLSLAIEFDCYLIDEVIAVGDALFRQKCETELFQQRGERAFIIASHDLEFIYKTCSKALIIEQGVVTEHDSIDEAIYNYSRICERAAGMDTGLELYPPTRVSGQLTAQKP
jgi:capsular polysaccharide transport system ATP-binding protein